MLYLIDGSSQMYRAFHAPVRTAEGGFLRNAQGRPTNAVYIFVTMLRKLLNEHKPEYIAASFDLPGRTFRDELVSDYLPLLQRHVTVERVREQFAGIVAGEIRRYELPGIGALNFVLQEALAGGVTRSLALDPHGKSLSSVMLDLELPDLAGRS